MYVFSEQNRHHKTVSRLGRGHKRAAKIMRLMWQASLGATWHMVQLICSLSDTVRNTYDIVYNVVYNVVYDIAYDM